MKLVFSLLLFAAYALGQTTTFDVISNWASNSELKHASIGIAIHNIDDGYLIAGYNHQKSMIPASSLKVLTTLITLQRLGKDYKFETKIAYDGNIIDGILYGNVYILGSGDPSLASRRFADQLNFYELTAHLANKIKDAGINKIEGEIIADVSIFDTHPIVHSWQWDDISSYYGCGVWGINVNENEYEIWYNTNKSLGEIADVLSIVPKIPNLNITNEVFIAGGETDDESYIFGDPYHYDKRIVGSLPQDDRAIKIKGAIPDPPSLLANAVIEELKFRGVEVGPSKVNNYKNYNEASMNQIVNILSPNLVDLVKDANYYSLNLYCEAFLKILAYHKGGFGSTISGVNQIKAYLSERGLDFSGLNMEDGSGLSARNLITPNLLSGFLASFAKENGIEFTSSVLPGVGSDGTVRRFLRSSPIKGNIWMKSGSMKQVMTYTGLMRAGNGKWLSFSIMVNAYTQQPSEMRKLVEDLVENIYKSI